jgi:outer membrane receptor protein involved in Fe transport
MAREAVYQIDIPAGPLSASLARFSELTGISVGMAGPIPLVTARRVRGRMTPEAALREILKGSGLRARRLGTVYSLEKMTRPVSARLARPEPVVLPETPPAPDILVTAQKRPENLASVPMSLSIVSLANESSTPSARDISLSIEGLATTNLGPGRNRQFIRGVADSPFNGKSQSTVAVQIDDARVTFDAPNPDLRLIDMERVEVLKGPQGPLYGSGALGGIYHLITRRPELDTASGWSRLSVEGVEHGGVEGGLEAMFNLPLVGGRLGLRGVAYRVIDPGWIDNSDGRKNSNSTKTAGARLSLRWLPSSDWTVDAGIAWQDIDARDSQYVLTSEEDLTRDSHIAEPTDNDFKMAHVTIEHRFNALRLVAATSVVNQGFDYVLDATEAAASFGLTGSARFEDSRRYSVFNQEIRLAPASGKGWLVGLSLLRATTRGNSTMTGEPGEPRIVEILDRKITEYALFGEASWPLFATVDATVGARVFRSVSRDLATDLEDQRTLRRRRTLFSPSASLSLPLDGQGIVYLRYARAKRPGGLAPSEANETGEFDADKVNTFDLGTRRWVADGRVSLTASAYYTRWDRVQSDYLLPNGLVSTRNAGRASIVGIEAGLDWKFGDGISLAAGGAAQRARLTRAEDGSQLDHRRLPVTPALSARMSLSKTISLDLWQGIAAIQANYIGHSRLSFDSDLDRTMGGYADLSANMVLSKGVWTIGIKLDNLLDIQGDSFSFGNPFSIRKVPQFTPVRPRSVLFSFSRRW